MILYNCKTSIDHPSSFVITKFDDDLNVESSYTTSFAECECPAGVRPSCRHRQMLPHFIAEGRVDTDWCFCYDDQSWHQPWGSLYDEEIEAMNDGLEKDFQREMQLGADDPVVRSSAPAGEVEQPAAPSPAPFRRRI